MDSNLEIASTILKLANDNARLTQELKTTSELVFELAKISLEHLEFIADLRRRVAALERKINQ